MINVDDLKTMLDQMPLENDQSLCIAYADGGKQIALCKGGKSQIIQCYTNALIAAAKDIVEEQAEEWEELQDGDEGVVLQYVLFDAIKEIMYAIMEAEKND